MCVTGCTPEDTPDLFLARSPRTWLACVLEGQGVRYKDFAARIGVSAGQLSNHFGRVRALGRGVEERVIDALALCPRAAAHYRLLVRWDRARSRSEAEEAEVEVLGSRLRARGPRVSEATVRALPGLDALAVRELTLCAGARADPSWLGGRLLPPRPPDQVAGWIDLLLRLGLLCSPRPGQLEPAPLSVTVDPELSRQAVRALFHEARATARWALDAVPHEERAYGQLVLGAPAGRVEELKREVEALRARIQARCDRASQEGRRARRVYALLLELFPLSRSLAEDPEAHAIFVPAPPSADDEPAGEGRPPHAPRIVHFRDYRRFLAVWRSWADRSLGELERDLGARIGEGAPTRGQLHAILHQRAHVAPEHADAWAAQLRLSEADAACFRAQILAQQASDPAEALTRWEEVQAWRQRAEARPLPSHCAEVMGSWISLATLELANSRAFVGDPAWIAGALYPPLRPVDVSGALELLLALGLLEYTGAGDLVRPAGPGLVVPDSVRVAAVRDLFGQICALAARALDELPASARELGLLVVAIPDSVWPEVVQDLERTQQRVQGWADALLAGDERRAAEPLDQVFVWSTALFPLSGWTVPRPLHR